jgi:type IV secretion system protein VirB10
MSPNTNETGHTVEGERTVATTARSKSSSLAQRGFIAASVAGAFIAILWFAMDGDPKKKEERPERVTISRSTEFEAAPQPKPAPPPPQPATAPQPVTVTPVEKAEPQIDELMESARRAPVLAFNRNTGAARPQTAAGDDAAALNAALATNGLSGQGLGQGDMPPRNTLNDKLQPTVLEGAKAGTLGNRNFIVAMGTSIPCVLETAMASDTEGFVTCVINRDVMSDNGRVVLMDKGTQVVGEYRGQLRRGQKRMFVLWNRAKTPKGVIVQLASPATDALGRSGFDGKIDTHFWERFGGALLMSVVGDATAYLGKKLSDQDIEGEGVADAGKQAAAIAVEQSINIPPTLRKNQGEPVNIFVARDLDFSSVYSLNVTETRGTIYDRAVMGDFYPRNGLVTK